TLVELIVVIVILAILATIAFLSFSSQSASARDSTRLADMSNIAKWLSVFNATAGKYPAPEAAITIYSSWTPIWQQWYAGGNVLWMIKVSNGWKDPLDGATYYTYLTNITNSKFQLLWFLEDWSNTALSMMPFRQEIPAFARMTELEMESANADPSSYSGRYILTKWDALWVILNNATQVPVNATPSSYSTWLELKNYQSSELMAYVSKNNTLISTWTMIGWLAWIYTAASAWSKYPGCDTNDIKLSNWQAWSACNVWATNAWNNQTALTNYCGWWASDCVASLRYTLWSYFQWWKNTDVTPEWTPTSTPAAAWTLANTTAYPNFIMNASANYDWLANADKNDDLWGGWISTSSSWTYSSLWSPATMQWPCASWYHVPTQKEWCDAAMNLNWALTCVSAWKNDTTLASTLKLPLAGYRNYSNAGYSPQGFNGYYWSASPNGTFAYILNISSTQVYLLGSEYRALGFTVRCLKN
ncbi:MAG: hypothetical protein ACD_3C00089G0001, partial [uncultured bacterium (gcode 4)]